MPRLVGIRDGHRVIITVTGRRGTMTVTRRHHPDCPCPGKTTTPDQSPA